MPQIEPLGSLFRYNISALRVCSQKLYSCFDIDFKAMLRIYSWKMSVIRPPVELLPNDLRCIQLMRPCVLCFSLISIPLLTTNNRSVNTVVWKMFILLVKEVSMFFCVRRSVTLSHRDSTRGGLCYVEL